MISNTIKNSLSWYLQQGTPNKITPRLLYPHSLHICSNSDFVSGIFCCSLAPAEPLGDHQPLPGQCSRCPCLLCKGSTWIPCSFPGAPDTSPHPGYHLELYTQLPAPGVLISKAQAPFRSNFRMAEGMLTFKCHVAACELCAPGSRKIWFLKKSFFSLARVTTKSKCWLLSLL